MRSARTARISRATRSTRRPCCSTRTRAASPRATGTRSGARWSSTTASTGATSSKPRIPLDRTVVYEAHVKGLTKREPRRAAAPARHLRRARAPERRSRTCTGSASPRSSCCPCTRSPPSRGCSSAGSTNYWGYNTLELLRPARRLRHEAPRRRRARRRCCAEFKGMVRLLHEAGIEVILDVVYNHTAEEGIGGPRTSLRGIDNANYYRQQPRRRLLRHHRLRQHARHLGRRGGAASCSTRCGTGRARCRSTASASTWPPRSAATRDHVYDPEHPLLQRIRTIPALQDTKIIAEPWDVGLGGWQTGNFPRGWTRVERPLPRPRAQLLADRHRLRARASAPDRHRRLREPPRRDRANTFSDERGPLASVNFVTAHDGFTLHDLVAYDGKHNEANGEDNRDGSDNNRSFNHGVEGPTDGPRRSSRRGARRCATCSAPLLLSAGVPMLTAGDEFGRTQRGNNNAYCQDSALTWLSWDDEPWQQDLTAHVAAADPAARGRTRRCARRSTPGSASTSRTPRSWTGSTRRRADGGRAVERAAQPHAAVRRRVDARQGSRSTGCCWSCTAPSRPIDVRLPVSRGRDPLPSRLVERRRTPRRRRAVHRSR